MERSSRRRATLVEPQVYHMVPRAETYPPYPTTAYAHYQPVAKGGPMTDQSGIYPPCLISEPRAYKGEPEVTLHTGPHTETFLTTSFLQSYYIAPEGVPRYERLRRDVIWDNHSAPPPLPRPIGQRYPKEYRNQGTQFDSRNGNIYEYPDEPYGYGDAQNARGQRKVFGPNGRQVRVVAPGPSRAITDMDKNLQGVVYHPKIDKSRHERAPERYRDGKVYEFDNNLHYRRVQ
nr:hypothetical protein CFP56_02826 [Quercus suber]